LPDSALEGKLSHAAEKNAKATWETSRPPRGLKQGETNRLFVASGGFWRGCFTLADDVLYNLADEQAPFSFVFDTRTWTPISVVPVKRFRGMIGAIPIEVSAAAPV
jgi:hypothetical protein